MEHLVCKCNSEYDVDEVATRGWRCNPIDTPCEVCGAILKPWIADVYHILIMTKRGPDRKAALPAPIALRDPNQLAGRFGARAQADGRSGSRVLPRRQA
jgi:hypothetical protein